MDDVQWSLSGSASTNDGDEADNEVDGQLELDELSDVDVNGFTPLDGSVDRIEIVIQDNQIRVVLGNFTSASHAESNIGFLEGFSISDAVSGDGDESTLHLGSCNKNELVFRRGSSNNLEVLSDIFELEWVLKDDVITVGLIIPFSVVVSNSLHELFSRHNDSIFVFLFFGDDAGLDSNESCGFDVVTGYHLDVDLTGGGGGFWVFIVGSDGIDGFVNVFSNWVLETEGTEIG